ncbi:MAG: LamG domain-containing protein, partial [Bacteroidota bacterium]
ELSAVTTNNSNKNYLSFNGQNQYVAIEKLHFDDENPIPQLTVEAWVKTDFQGVAINDNWAIVGFDRSDFFSFYVRGDNGKVGFSTCSEGALNDMSGTTIVNDNEWHHLAVVYDGIDKIIYVDGVEDARVTNAHGGNPLGWYRVRFGFIGDGSEATTFDGSRNEKYFKGELTEIRLWESVRTSSEIQDFYQKQLHGDDDGLLLYYNFNEGTGDQLIDKSGNGHHGQMTNMNQSWIAGGPNIDATISPAKILLERSLVLYRQESMDDSVPLPFGQVASHALTFESYQLALTPELIHQVLNRGDLTRVTPEILLEGQYNELLNDGHYWIPSGKAFFDTEHFFLPLGQEDPFGNRSDIAYDPYHVLVTSATDPIGNQTQAVYDYRLLQPSLVTDINGNQQEFDFDVRGMVRAHAVMGKPGANEGDTIADPTSTFEYDLFRWTNEQKPNFARSLSREEHQVADSRKIESYAYSNGLGQVMMTKSRVQGGLAFGREPDGSLTRDQAGKPVLVQTDERWVGNGRTILDNKGNLIKQYEPYFSSTFAYEDEPELVEYGVSPVVRYDPLGRAIRTELPDDTVTRVVFDPWKQLSYDQNDTVLESLWYVNRNSPDGNAPEPTDPN